MATTTLLQRHAGEGETIAEAIRDCLDYGKDPEKTESGKYISAYECDPATVADEFLLAKASYAAMTGREQKKENNVLCYQIRQSFYPGEITPKEANRIGYELAMRWTKGRHAFIVTTHTDKQHIHCHIYYNSTTLDCTRKFRNFWGSSFALRRLSDRLCLENGLSIVENPKPRSKSKYRNYGEWQKDRKGPLLNKLFENVIWGQKSNFLDVPTDCPQRDERLGWTGDAQVFIRTACLNFDAERFFTKWLADLAADQREDGAVGHVIPNVLHQSGSAAWDDAATICPWAVYLAYGDPNILRAQFASMKKWVDYITAHTTTRDLWTGGEHYGDWLGLDAPSGSYKGSSREDLIASAFYAHSTALVIKAGRVLGQDISAYEALYERIVRAFRQAYPVYQTQTECTLAIYFALAEDTQKAADQLAQMIRSCGTKLQTGFVGTPYLLHALSAHGYTELAYDLLLRREYPSWLYPVTKGATTIWEHWDGQMENGDFWSSDMNSFNHYAYGAVADWVYTVAAGIQTVEEKPGYAAVRIAPQPDKRLDWLEASVETRHGLVRSRWEKQRDMWRYEIETPVEAEVVIDGRKTFCRPGRYIFFSELA